MTSPKSGASKDNVLGFFLLLVISLAVIVPIVILASGMSITPPVQASPSHPTLQARVDALETQVSKLSREIGNDATVLEKSTPAPTRTPRPSSEQSLIVIVGAANVRAGPAATHEVLGVVEQGQTLSGPLSTQSGWHQVCCVEGNQQGWISSELVADRNQSSASAIPAPLIQTVTPLPTITKFVTSTPSNPITSPPPSLGAAPIYTKYLQAQGAHIVALADVNDWALLQARDILFGMTSTRPDLFSAMTRTGLRIIIFNHRTTPLQKLPEFKDWPLAAVRAGGFAKDASGYTIAAPEYRLKCTPTLVHEIAHAIDYAIQPHAPWFSEKRDSAYQNAMASGLWKGEYAATDKHEYWAVSVERHFRRQAGEAALSQKDPELAKLVVSVFGDAQIPPC